MPLFEGLADIMAVSSLRAGRRDTRIVIERFAEVGRDSLNQPIMSWAEHAKLWANVFFGTGAEQRAAAQTEATQAASFEVLASTKTRSITTADRIAFMNGHWDIRAVVPIGLAGIKINAVMRLP